MARCRNCANTVDAELEHWDSGGYFGIDEGWRCKEPCGYITIERSDTNPDRLIRDLEQIAEEFVQKTENQKIIELLKRVEQKRSNDMHSAKEMLMGDGPSGDDRTTKHQREEKNLRDKMKKDAKAMLIHEWDYENVRYRLVARGNFSAGYEDEYIIEILEADALGEPRWTASAQCWKNDRKDDVKTILVAAIKSLIKAVQ